MGVDGCSVYLIDTAGSHYVLMATDGLNPAVVGKFRFGCNEGIVGFVGERQEPVNLENASDHPRFRYSPELGTDPYHAFLGVPLIHFRRVLGVLVTRLRIRAYSIATRWRFSLPLAPSSQARSIMQLQATPSAGC